MEYYHSIITEKSWQELTLLKNKVDFVLIGGWAVYLFAKALKSKDIDILLDFSQLPVLEKNYRLEKNERLKKYQAVKKAVEIDIYLPHFSNFFIPVEILIKQTEIVDGFKVLNINYLFALKLLALQERGRSEKGRKDFLDILSLALSGRCDWQVIKKIITEYKKEEALNVFKDFLQETSEIKELGLNAYKLSKLKKEIKLYL